jgi:8-oxo-dGTP pyrophosphatase MutT (NUDIX family)
MADDRCFHVTVKGLVFDERGAPMLLRERSGGLDLPGGRLEHGEELADCLVRECREEMGVRCSVLDRVPRFAWTARDKEGVWRLVLCFAIELESFEFTESEECVGYRFVVKQDLDSPSIAPQIRPLAAWL